MIKSAKDYMENIRANRVACYPLEYGCEFTFQSSAYLENFKRFTGLLGEAGTQKTNIPLFIEYKRNKIQERRNVAKILWILQCIREKNYASRYG